MAKQKQYGVRRLMHMHRCMGGQVASCQRKLDFLQSVVEDLTLWQFIKYKLGFGVPA